jgi:PPP family 3-phenylpropionic acid transporter
LVDYRAFIFGILRLWARSLRFFRCIFSAEISHLFEIAVLLGISPTLRILVPFFWAWLADHWGQKHKLLCILALISPAIFAFMIAKGSFFSVAGVLIVWGLLWSGILPIAEALCVEALGEEMSVYGRVRVWGSIGFILVVVGGGYLFEWIDVLYLDWIICGLLISCLVRDLNVTPGCERGVPFQGI